MDQCCDTAASSGGRVALEYRFATWPAWLKGSELRRDRESHSFASFDGLLFTFLIQPRMNADDADQNFLMNLNADKRGFICRLKSLRVADGSSDPQLHRVRVCRHRELHLLRL